MLRFPSTRRGFKSERHPAETVFAELETLVDRFEEIAQGHGLEKIKTVGDAFMATVNLLSPLDEPVHAAIAGALDMVAATPSVRADWAVRVGIDFGPVSAGIMGGGEPRRNGRPKREDPCG